VREGDHVQAGQVIATLDDQQIRAREQPAEAAVRQAEARVELSRHQITVLGEQLRQNEIGVDQSRADAAGRVSEAEAKLAAAEAQLAQANASYAQAKWDHTAYTKLFKQELIAEQQARQAEASRKRRPPSSPPRGARSRLSGEPWRPRARTCRTRRSVRLRWPPCAGRSWQLAQG